MTSEQKLDYLYKKLVNDRAFTKNATTFFEEPISTFSQVPLDYIYVNSLYIPTTAPGEDVIFNGDPLITYVVDEVSISLDREGKKFKTRNGRLIPTSYGSGYGVTIKLRDGLEVDINEFPVLIDWESGEIIFDEVPLEIDRENTPLLTYYFYSGKTLKNIESFSVQGQRGDIGPIGESGPINDSTLIYRGETDFTVSPPLDYKVNDVITFTTNGNSYICIIDTSDSPIDSPSSWQNISPSGTSSQIPENVIFVYDQASVPLSNFSEGTPGYSTSIQDTIDQIDETHKTLLVNHKSNLSSLCDSLTIENRDVDILFEKGGLICTKPISQSFALDIKDSNVIFKNATIGRDIIDPECRIIIEAITSDTTVKFIDCVINSQLLTIKRNESYNCTIIFENCSMNMKSIDCNADIEIINSKFSGNYLFDYDIQGISHKFTVNNSFYYSSLDSGNAYLDESESLIFRVDRSDIENCSIKFENSFLPQVGFILSPAVNSYSPIDFVIDSNNSVFFSVGLDKDSAFNAGAVRVIGINNGWSIFFETKLSSFRYPDIKVEGTFLSILPNDAVVVIFDSGASIVYDSYKNLKIRKAKYSMISL